MATSGSRERISRVARGPNPPRTVTRIFCDVTITKFSYIYCNGSERLRLFRESPRYFDRIFLSQEGRDFFSARREAPGGSYFLERQSEEKGRLWRNAFRYLGEDIKTAPYTPLGCSSPDHPSYLLLVNSPDFQIQRVVQEPEAGKTLHKMFFRYRTTRPKEPTIEGWLSPGPVDELGPPELRIRQQRGKGQVGRPQPARSNNGWTFTTAGRYVTRWSMV